MASASANDPHPDASVPASPVTSTADASSPACAAPRTTRSASAGAVTIMRAPVVVS